MDETEYKEQEEFAKQMRNLLLYDMKSPTSMIATAAEVMKTLLEQIQEKGEPPSQEDLDSIYQIAEILSDTSQRLMNNIYTLSDELETLIKKYRTSD